MNNQNKASFSTWYLKLRWYAFFGQLAVLVLAVAYFELTLPWLMIASMLALIPASNFLITWPLIRYKLPFNTTAWLLSLDTFILTAILHQSGGPMNPFSLVFLLHVVLAAILLTPMWAWSITVLSCLGYGLLFIHSKEIPEWHVHGAHHGFSVHLYGMLFAFVLVAFLVTYFVEKIVGELRKKERRLERFETLEANQQRLTSLTALTAGAAHELGTPLGTIALISKELELQLNETAINKVSLLEDVAVLQREVARSKGILEKMALSSGDLLGEQPRSISAKELLLLSVKDIKDAEKLKVQDSEDIKFDLIPVKATSLALKAIIKNALEEDDNNVKVIFKTQGAFINITIQDSGSGISEDVLQRVGEPFFSTKGAEKGMGLGVYLARLTFEQMGGKLTIESQRGPSQTGPAQFGPPKFRQGTIVTIEVPRSVVLNERAA